MDPLKKIKCKGGCYHCELVDENILKVHKRSAIQSSTEYYLLETLYPLFTEQKTSFKRHALPIITTLLISWILLITCFHANKTALIILFIVSTLISTILLCNDYLQMGNSYFLFESSTDSQLYLFYRKKDREKVYLFAKHLSKLCLKRFMMPQISDQSRIAILLEDLFTEKIISAEEYQSLKNWYFPDIQEKKIGFKGDSL